jgi:hypothetical protein
MNKKCIIKYACGFNTPENLISNEISTRSLISNYAWYPGQRINILFMNEPDETGIKNRITAAKRFELLKKKYPDYNEYNLLKLMDTREFLLEVDKLVDQREAMKYIINERIAPYTNLSFKYFNTPGPPDTIFHIRVLFKNPSFFDVFDGFHLAADSQLGNNSVNSVDQNNPSLNIVIFSPETILHEMGHALGMIHTHQTNLCNPIEWDLDELKKDYPNPARLNTNFLERPEGQLGYGFDPKSIMSYDIPKRYISQWGNPKYPEGVTVKNYYLAVTDVLTIQQIYGKNSFTEDATQWYIRVYGGSRYIQPDMNCILKNFKLKKNISTSNYYLHRNIFLLIIISVGIFIFISTNFI